MRKYLKEYSNDKSYVLLVILDILRRFGDKLNKREMQDKLAEIYDIHLARNTFASKLEVLDRCGYKLREEGDRYVFEGREFTDAQLRVLIDLLISSSILSPETAKKMIEELCELGSDTIRRECKKFQSRVEGRKRSTDTLADNIALIQQAISGGVRLSCNYKVFTGSLALKEKYSSNIVVSPFELTLSNGRYILICAIDGEDTFTHFYADKLCDLALTRTPVRPVREIEEFRSYGDMNSYIAAQPVLCGGRKQTFELKCDKEVINDFMNDFGGEFRRIPMHEESDGYNIVISVSTSAESLKRLILPYYGKIIVLGQPELNGELDTMFRTGLHNSQMIGKPGHIKAIAAKSYEEALRVCETEDLHIFRYSTRPFIREKEVIDLSELTRVDWVTALHFDGLDLRGQRFPDELKGITGLSLIRCKFDVEMIAELTDLKRLRVTDITAAELEKLSGLTKIERFALIDDDRQSRGKPIHEVSCDAADLGFLSGWENLNSVEIYGCKKLCDISALADKKELSRVCICDCAVTDEQLAELSEKHPDAIITGDNYRHERKKNRENSRR